MRHRALTLVEVIVVVAIIIVLAAIMVPILGKTKQKGTEVSATQTLRSYAQALELYRADWGVGPAGEGSHASALGYPHDMLAATAGINAYGFVYSPCDPGCVEVDVIASGTGKCPWITFLSPTDSHISKYGESYAIMGGMCYTDPSIPFGNFSFPHTGIGIRADHSLIRYTKSGMFKSQPWWHDQEPEVLEE